MSGERLIEQDDRIECIMGDDYPVLTAAAVQAAPVFLNREQTVDKACDLIIEAGTSGADVVVFSEGFIPGHPLWYHFHPATGNLAKQLATRLVANAVEVPGPTVDRLAHAADEANVYVTMGVCEKEPNSNGTLYNSQLFFSPAGQLIGKHQKIKPTVGERLVHADGKRHTFGSIQTEYGPMSGLICGENSNPLAIFTLAAEQTRIHSMSWPPAFSNEGGMPSKVLTYSRAFAQMTKAYVISSCGIADDRMINLMELTEEEADSLRSSESSGGSVIVGPDLEVIAGPLESETDILYAELDLELAVSRKLNHDFAGHYNRPDLFQLHIDRSPQDLLVDENTETAEPLHAAESRNQTHDRDQQSDDTIDESGAIDPAE